MSHRTLLLLITLTASSCTYAPRNTQIEQTFSARIMAIGVSDKGGITSTTHEGDDAEVAPVVAPVSRGFGLGSTYEEVVAIQGPPSMFLSDFVYFDLSSVKFRGGRVVSWYDSGNLKLRGKR